MPKAPGIALLPHHVAHGSQESHLVHHIVALADSKHSTHMLARVGAPESQHCAELMGLPNQAPWVGRGEAVELLLIPQRQFVLRWLWQLLLLLLLQQELCGMHKHPLHHTTMHITHTLILGLFSAF